MGKQRPLVHSDARRQARDRSRPPRANDGNVSQRRSVLGFAVISHGRLYFLTTGAAIASKIRASSTARATFRRLSRSRLPRTIRSPPTSSCPGRGVAPARRKTALHGADLQQSRATAQGNGGPVQAGWSGQISEKANSRPQREGPRGDLCQRQRRRFDRAGQSSCYPTATWKSISMGSRTRRSPGSALAIGM